MADRLDNLQLNNFASQTLQRPFAEAHRLLARSHGDGFHFLIAVEPFFDWRVNSLPSVEGLREPAYDEPPADVFDRVDTARQETVANATGHVAFRVTDDALKQHGLPSDVTSAGDRRGRSRICWPVSKLTSVTRSL